MLLQIPFHLHFLLQIGILSFVNVVIDFFGHSAYKGLRRTPATHSPLSATVIGGVYGVVFFFVLPYFGVVTNLLFMVLGGIVAAWTHLFLDSMTFSGIFVFKKRLAIAHFKNGLIDVPFLIISFVLILYMLGLMTGLS
jgi:hypothetical protein